MISRDEAIDLFESQDLVTLGMRAEAVRRRWHPERIVTYYLDSETTSSPDMIARVTFKTGETAEEHIDRLASIREMQEHGNLFMSLVPCFDATATEYLKMLAISRIYLESIPHVQTTCTLGAKLCQIALRFGADDIEIAAVGTQAPSEEELRCLIRDAGFIPKQRDAIFRTYSLR